MRRWPTSAATSETHCEHLLTALIQLKDCLAQLPVLAAALDDAKSDVLRAARDALSHELLDKARAEMRAVLSDDVQYARASLRMRTQVRVRGGAGATRAV